MGFARAFVEMLQIHGIMRRVPQELGTAKVNELQMAFCIQQQIFWLEVSVNHLQASAVQAELDDPGRCRLSSNFVTFPTSSTPPPLVSQMHQLDISVMLGQMDCAGCRKSELKEWALCPHTVCMYV